MNTATYRAQARAAHQRLDWQEAARLYDLAADNYPQPYPKPGALAVADIQRLRERAAECRSMARTGVT